MNEGFVRRPSGLESFFIDLDTCGCNMTFHYFLKLNKKPSLKKLDAAMAHAVQTHDGINLRFVKNLWRKSDYLPSCSIVEIESDDIYNYKATRLNFRKNTIALNVLHISGTDTWYLCFDFFHGAVDGRSGILFIYDFFQILNGGALKENNFSISDQDIIIPKGKPVRWMGKNKIPLRPSCVPKYWKPRRNGEDRTIVLKTDALTRGSAAKLAAAVAKCFTSKTAKMIIPVDIRRFAKESGSVLFGNLIAPIFIDANTLRKVDELHTEIIEYVKQKPLLTSIISKLSLYNRFPVKLRQAILRILIPMVMASNRFICCALVSPIGLIESSKLQTKDFQVEDVSVTFISFPFTAFTVTSVQFNDHTNTTIAWHSGRVSKKAVSSLMEDINCCIHT